MKTRTLLPIIFLCALFTGCTSIQKLMPVATPAASGTVLFSDDFSDPKGWGTLGRSGGSVEFNYEGMMLTVNTPNTLFWTVNGKNYSDMTIDVDAVLLDGPANDNFGVLCRFQDNEHFYGFVISHDGYYGIFKMKDGAIEPLLTPDAMRYSDKIRQGGVVNHLQALCQGNTLMLDVNGDELISVSDPDFQSGQIGLIGGAYEQAGVVLFFDNLVVTQP